MQVKQEVRKMLQCSLGDSATKVVLKIGVTARSPEAYHARVGLNAPPVASNSQRLSRPSVA